MKIVAISDVLMSDKMLRVGMRKIVDAGHTIDITPRWGPDSIEELQEINLRVEQSGANAIELPADIFESLNDADVVVTQFAPIGRRVIESLPKLKAIGVLRGGTENVDSEAASAHGVAVINTPGRNARAVAEFTVGMIIAETRNIARADAAMKDAVWLKDFPNAGQVRELNGLVLGVIGAGAIGQLVMRFMSNMDMKCQFFDPYRGSSEYGTKVDDLDDLMRTSDVITVHSRLTEANYHMIDAAKIALMKHTAVLVNTARSGLVDEKALREALQAKKIMGAAIDTFDVEPLSADSPWLALGNVTITSHLAGSTVDAFLKTPGMLADRLLAETNLFS